MNKNKKKKKKLSALLFLTSIICFFAWIVITSIPSNQTSEIETPTNSMEDENTVYIEIN